MPSSNPNAKPSRQSAYRSYRRQLRKPPISMPVDLSAFNQMLAGIEEDIAHALRPAVQAGAEVIYRAVLRNVDSIGVKTGRLRSSIYQAFSERDSKAVEGGYSRVTYDVSWNPKKAPHGHLVEYGYIQKFKVYLGKDGKWYTNKKAPLASPKQVPARSFMRRATSSSEAAADAVVEKFWQVMNAK
jgi:hypothetical protein